MSRSHRTLALASAAALVAGLGAGAVTTSAAAAPNAPVSASTADIKDRIASVPGVKNLVERAAPAGYRFFTMTFTQPSDHDDPSQGTFDQRITLLHKDVARPMVMYTSGYYVSSNPSRSEPTQIVDGNQLSMEYRFFAPSIPASPNWAKELTIKQAAADQHRIIEAFKAIYAKNWLTTGGSKGGMTATYHRAFYPKDVSGTIPYVAPNDVVDTDDVYNAFLDQVGTKGCRNDLTALQRKVLMNRAWFEERTAKDAAAYGYTWDIVGSLPKAMESAVVDMFFAFWQYQPASACATVPKADTATNEQVYQFFERISPLTTYADQSVGYYTPYYYQASTQLGAPEPYETHLADLLEFPGSDVAPTFVPAELKPLTFDTKAMPAIDRIVRTHASRMLYIYGQNDPWSAEPFDCGKNGAKRECVRYVVPGGNHGSRISQLPADERATATALVLKWAGLTDGDKAAKQLKTHGKPAINPALDKVPDYLRSLGR